MGSRNRTGYKDEDDICYEKTILKGGNEYQNMSCTVFLHLKGGNSRIGVTRIFLSSFGAHLYIDVHTVV